MIHQGPLLCNPGILPLPSMDLHQDVADVLGMGVYALGSICVFHTSDKSAGSKTLITGIFSPEDPDRFEAPPMGDCEEL